jgi:hypothetical protein
MTDALQPLHQLVARSNRIGDDPSLVVYGGGNTSAKGLIIDHLGRGDVGQGLRCGHARLGGFGLPGSASR